MTGFKKYEDARKYAPHELGFVNPGEKEPRMRIIELSDYDISERELVTYRNGVITYPR